MNPWTQVAIDELKKGRGPHVPRGTPQVLSDMPGLGQSRIIVLAWPHDWSIALVVPSTKRKEGWQPRDMVTHGGLKSPAELVAHAYFDFLGLCFIAGTAKPQVARLHFELADGSQVDANVRDGGFLVVTEVDPIPFEATVLKADGQVLDRFRIPPERAK